MKKYLLYICVATLLISCRKDEVLPTTESGTMSFTAQLSSIEDDWSAHSRGAMTTSGTITNFSAFGFRTGSLKWAENGSSTVPNKMFNQLVERSGNAWVYTPSVKWEAGDVSHFSFFGFSPYCSGTYDVASNPLGNNIEMVSSDATADAPVISFAPLADLSSQIDLLVAKPVLDTRPVDHVKMNFVHALTQISFKGWTDQPKTEITSIKIKGVVGKGSLNIGSLEWVAGSEIAEYDYAFSALEVSTDKTSMTDLSPDNNTFMLLPQDLTANTTAVVEFSYTIDEVSIVKEYVLKENWKRNQAMTYTVNLTLADEPLGMTVEITPWRIGTGGLGDADVEVVLEEGSYIPNSVLLAAGWPVDILPIEGGLQVAMIGNVLPGGTPAAEDPKMQLKTSDTGTSGVESITKIADAKFGMGKSGTDAMTIPSQIDLHPAAKYCRAMGRGWYLPSHAELRLIQTNKSLLGDAYAFNATYYWIATQRSEDSGSTAYLLSPSNSSTTVTGPKKSPQAVRCVKGTLPLPHVAVTPYVQADIPFEGGTYTVQLTSNYAWTASSTISGVTITPSSGAAGTDVSVEITVPANATTSAVSYPVVFTATGGDYSAITMWTGTQLPAPPPIIEIDGIKWATGNLVADGANGAKIGASTDYGLYFQFGSLIGWAGGTTGDGTGVGSPTLALNVKPAAYGGSTDYAACGYYDAGDTGSGLPATDDASTGIGDPCRFYLGGSWRLPTSAEFLSLCNGYTGGADFSSADIAWSDSPVGMNFKNSSTKLFIPASGLRNDIGEIRSVGKDGYYWSESVFDSDYGDFMFFSSYEVTSEGPNHRRYGMPVRCVMPPPPPAAVISVTPTTQADMPAAGGTYTVKVTSNYNWWVSDPSGTVNIPEYGAAGKDIEVVITVPANATTSVASYSVEFTTTGGGTTATTTWSGTQLAAPPAVISVTPTTQADIPAAGGKYTVQLTSNYAWSAISTSGVMVTPASGAAGVNVSVEISIPVNTRAFEVSKYVAFTATDGGYSSTTEWTGTQLAAPPALITTPHPPTADQIIDINGVKWTTGNLVAADVVNAKVGTPTDNGLYFQFGSLIGWAGGASGDGTGTGSPTLAINVKPSGYSGNTDYTTCGYYAPGATSVALPDNDDVPTGVGDPCRLYLGKPWRTPTMTEFVSLCNDQEFGSAPDLANAEWQVSPVGMNLNNSSTKLFMPAAGLRDYSNTAFKDIGVRGYYWSSSVYNYGSGYRLNLYITRVTTDYHHPRNSLPVRCVQ